MKSLIGIICVLGIIGILVAGIALRDSEIFSSSGGLGITSVLATDTGGVNCTVVPQLIAVSVADGSIDYGNVALSATANSTSGSQTQTATNDGNTAAKFEIKSSDATGGTTWELDSTVDLDQYIHKFDTDGGGNGWTQIPVDNDTYESLAYSVGASGEQTFDLQITMPSSVTEYDTKSISVTIHATTP